MRLKVTVFKFCSVLFVFCAFTLEAQLVDIELPSDITTKIDQLMKNAASADENNDDIRLAEYYNSLAFLYWDYESTKKAVEFFEKSIEVNERSGNQNAVQKINNNLGMIFYDAELYDRSINKFESSLEINKQLKRRIDLASDNYNIALAYQGKKNFVESNEYADKALVIFQENNNISGMKNCYSLMAENHEALGNSAQSINYYDLFMTLTQKMQKDKMRQIETQIQHVEKENIEKEKELAQTFDTLKNIKETAAMNEVVIDSLFKKSDVMNLMLAAERKAKKTIIYAAIAVILLILIFLVFIYTQFKIKKRSAIVLSEKNIKIEKQKEEIEAQRDFANEQTKKIKDSIRYAQRIQNAILPPVNQIQNTFEDHFILFKPRDIVSGDFYWFTQKEDVAIVAAVDCTGHGVPGAFMSMLGVAFLNEIVNKIVINKHINSLNANDILNKLREQIINSLHQSNDGDESKDGMDMALCVIDFNQNKLQFSGAHNPLIIVRDTELIEFKGDRMPVSIHRKKDISFNNHEIDLKTGDIIYMFSDGIVDQFGGELGQKFLSKNLRNLITEISSLPMESQKVKIEEAFENWKGDREQLDDVLVFGVKYNGKKKLSSTDKIKNWSDKKVLIVEDTDVNYILLVEALRKTDVQIQRAVNGKEAVDKCKNNFFDLILMDINLPEMDGKLATKEIRKFDKKIPIIAQTAQFDNSEKVECLKAGCDDFISKPIDLKTFLGVIEKKLFNL